VDVDLAEVGRVPITVLVVPGNVHIHDALSIAHARDRIGIVKNTLYDSNLSLLVSDGLLPLPPSVVQCGGNGALGTALILIIAFSRRRRLNAQLRARGLHRLHPPRISSLPLSCNGSYTAILRSRERVYYHWHGINASGGLLCFCSVTVNALIPSWRWHLGRKIPWQPLCTAVA